MSSSNTVINRETKTIRMSRVFDASPERLWHIYTDREYIPKWWGQRSSKTEVDRLDVRIGGGWRFLQSDGQGNVFAFRGDYKVVEPPKRLVATFEFEMMPGHVVTDPYLFEPRAGGKTEVIVSSQFESLDDLEGMVQSGMESGANESWDRLEELIATGAAEPKA
jgi:uncharacterized protein YndB with AHSA1/START domain